MFSRQLEQRHFSLPAMAGPLADMPFPSHLLHPILFRYLPVALASQTPPACGRPVYTNTHGGMLYMFVTRNKKPQFNHQYSTGMTRTAFFDEVDQASDRLDTESAWFLGAATEVL